MDGTRIVLTDSATDREAGVALRWGCGGCFAGFLLGMGAAWLLSKML